MLISIACKQTTAHGTFYDDARSGLVDWCLTALSAQTGYIVPQEYEIYHVGPGRQENHTINQ